MSALLTRMMTFVISASCFAMTQSLQHSVVSAPTATPQPSSRSQARAEHLRRQLTQEGKIVSELDQKLNQQNQRYQIEDQLQDLSNQIAQQRKTIQALKTQSETAKSQLFDKYSHQALNQQAAQLDLNIQLSTLGSQLQQKQMALQQSWAELERQIRSNITSNVLIQARRAYEENLAEFNEIQTRYRDLELQSMQQQELTRRANSWQERSDQQEFQTEFQQPLVAAEAQYDKLLHQYANLQKQAAEARLKTDELNQQYLMHRRNYDELQAEFEKYNNSQQAKG